MALGCLTLSTYTWNQIPLSGVEVEQLRSLFDGNVGENFLYLDPFNFRAPLNPLFFENLAVGGAFVRSHLGNGVPVQVIRSYDYLGGDIARHYSLRPTPFLVNNEYSDDQGTLQTGYDPYAGITNPTLSDDAEDLFGIFPDSLRTANPLTSLTTSIGFDFFTLVRLESFSFNPVDEASDISFGKNAIQYYVDLTLQEVAPLTSHSLVCLNVQELFATTGGSLPQNQNGVDIGCVTATGVAPAELQCVPSRTASVELNNGQSLTSGGRAFPVGYYGLQPGITPSSGNGLNTNIGVRFGNFGLTPAPAGFTSRRAAAFFEAGMFPYYPSELGTFNFADFQFAFRVTVPNQGATDRRSFVYYAIHQGDSVFVYMSPIANINDSPRGSQVVYGTDATVGSLTVDIVSLPIDISDSNNWYKILDLDQTPDLNQWNFDTSSHPNFDGDRITIGWVVEHERDLTTTSAGNSATDVSSPGNPNFSLQSRGGIPTLNEEIRTIVQLGGNGGSGSGTVTVAGERDDSIFRGAERNEIENGDQITNITGRLRLEATPDAGNSFDTWFSGSFLPTELLNEPVLETCILPAGGTIPVRPRFNAI